MGALGHYLEAAGIATTQISLIREHTEVISPPRAMWVPFIMGRPFGVPNDPAFQRRVLLAVLRLLEAPAGPLIVDYPEEAPQPAAADAGEEMEPFACPVNFGRAPADLGLAASIQREIAELTPWHDMTRKKRGNSKASLSGLTPAAAAQFVTDFIDDPGIASYRPDLPIDTALRLACQDLQTYYQEAVAAQPGARAALEAQQWFWEETAVSKAFFKVRDLCLQCDNEMLRRFGGRYLVPLSVAARPAEWA